MKIGINGRFLSAPLTGVQRVAHPLLQHLAHEADAILFAPAGAEVPAGFNGQVVTGRLRGHGWEQLELPLLVQQLAPDVLFHPANTLPLWPHTSVVLAHDPMLPLSQPHWFDYRYALWYRQVVARALRRARELITVSEWSRLGLIRALGVAEDRVSVMPQGLAPIDAPAGAAEVERVRRQYGLAGKYLLAVGGRNRLKNIRFLYPVLEALNRSAAAPVDLVVIGDASKRVHHADDAVVARADVRLLGQVDTRDTHALMTGASALCFPSLAEGFGRPPLEAIACGTPALVGAYAAAREVLGDAGRILPWETEAWVTALQQILADRSVRERTLAAAAGLRTRYSWAAAVQHVLAACARAAAAAPRTVAA